MSYFLPIILGTARGERLSERVAHAVVHELAARPNVTTELIDVRDWLKPATKRQKEEHAGQDEVQKKIIAADGYVIVSPEYNHGYPGELKIFLDTFYYEFAKKPAGIVGVSDGHIGGARMVEQLRLITIALGLVSLQRAVYFFDMPKPFNEQGELVDLEYKKRINGLFEELIWYAHALKPAREAQKK